MKFEEPIIIIGSARSGTHLIADCIRENLDVLYLGESNDIWKKHLPASKYDNVPDSFITPEVIKNIRKDFYKLVSGSKNKYWMEKTCSNSLRPNLVAAVFPEARFIHIIRDGRDVAISLEKKYKGDMQKIARGDGYKKKSFIEGYKILINYIVKHKIKRGFSIKNIVKNPELYIEGLLLPLGIPKMVGPRFIGFEYYFKNYDKLETGAIQWRESVLTSKNFFDLNSGLNIFEIRYENLLERPEETMTKVLNYLTNKSYNKKDIKHNVKTELKNTNWENTLSREKLYIIAEQIENVLLSLGYSTSDINEGL